MSWKNRGEKGAQVLSRWSLFDLAAMVVQQTHMRISDRKLNFAWLDIDIAPGINGGPTSSKWGALFLRLYGLNTRAWSKYYSPNSEANNTFLNCLILSVTNQPVYSQSSVYCALVLFRSGSWRVGPSWRHPSSADAAGNVHAPSPWTGWLIQRTRTLRGGAASRSTRAHQCRHLERAILFMSRFSSRAGYPEHSWLLSFSCSFSAQKREVTGTRQTAGGTGPYIRASGVEWSVIEAPSDRHVLVCWETCRYQLPSCFSSQPMTRTHAPLRLQVITNCLFRNCFLEWVTESRMQRAAAFGRSMNIWRLCRSGVGNLDRGHVVGSLMRSFQHSVRAFTLICKLFIFKVIDVAWRTTCLSAKVANKHALNVTHHTCTPSKLLSSTQPFWLEKSLMQYYLYATVY